MHHLECQHTPQKSVEFERIKHELENVKQRCESLDISVKESNDEKELMYTVSRQIIA